MSSKRGIRRNQCGTKKRHKTRKEANAARYGTCSKAELACTSAYKCRWCGGWHWGHFASNRGRKR